MAFNYLVGKSTMATYLRAGQFTYLASRLSACHLHTRTSGQHQLLTAQPTTSTLVVGHQQSRGMRLNKEKTLRKMYWRGRSFDKMKEQVRARNEWQDWNYSSELYAFGVRLGEPGLTEDALTQAFTHRSYVSAQKAKQEELGVADVQINLQDNVELIEEGRRLIETYSKAYLRYHLQAAPEECIESITQYLLSEAVLGDISKWIGCIDMVFCEEFPPSLATLADTVPAVISAISRASGTDRANRFIADFILTYLNGADMLEIWPLHQMDLDLNEYLRQKGEPEVEPRILHRSAIGTIESCYIVGMFQGPEHRLLGQAPGESLQIARRMAELDSFRNLFGLTVPKIRLSFGEKAQSLDLKPFQRKNFSLLEKKSPNQKKSSQI